VKRTLAAIVTLAGSVLAARGAHATTQIHANICANAGGGLGDLEYSSFGYGPYNGANSGVVNLTCPLSSQSADSIRKINIVVYDRNPSAAVTCRVFGLDVNGTQVYDSQILSSSGSGSSSQTLPAPTPPPTAVLFTASCTIPAAASGQFSHVTGFFMN
jgi:hypothetical protein